VKSVAVTASGEILVAGEAHGDLGGPIPVAGPQAVVTALSAAGDLLWAEKLSLPARSGALSIAVDSGGDIFLGGHLGVVMASDALLVRLTPTEPLAGDYSRDGVVDVTDYNLWRDRYGQQRSLSVTDGNDDGVVDAADYTIWRDNLTAPSSLEVPEPVALPLAVLAMIALACSRRSDAR
jgi:hypothetical protein